MNLVHKYRIDIFQDLFVFDALAYPAFKKDKLKNMVEFCMYLLTHLYMIFKS